MPPPSLPAASVGTRMPATEAASSKLARTTTLAKG